MKIKLLSFFLIFSYFHSVALNANNGSNTDGQLGDGTLSDKNIPTIISSPNPLVLNVNLLNITCQGMKNASANAIVEGGTAPYSYLWSTGSTSSSVKDLAPGTYTCKATDANSLTTIISFTITEPNFISFIATTVNACNGTNGNITIVANGGTPPYQYSITELGLVYQDSNIFTNLASGNYSVTVRDNNGCITMMPVVINSYTTSSPTANSQTFDKGATVANLQASGSNIKWYISLAESNPLSLSTALQTGKYYVSQIINGCESSRTAVDVTVNPVKINGVIPADGLLFYYPFNGNTTDISGNNISASTQNLTLTSDRFGNSNSAYSFNGTSSGMDANLSNYPQTTSSRTITGWFKANEPVASSEFDFCLVSYGAATDSFKMSLYRKGYFDINFDSKSFSSQENYFNNEWSFFAMIFDENTKKFSLYINNILKINETVDSFKGFSSLCKIGKNNSNNYFEGTLDDLGLWNRALTPQEIADLYNYVPEYTLIPDINFEKTLITLGLDSGAPDGKVLTSKISSTKDLYISSKSISDLTGIQSFKSLVNLDCDSNNLTTIDVSKNTALNYLSVGDNHLTSLDVSKNLALKDLYFHNNQLTSIDVSKNTNLKSLYFVGNSISSLDVSKNTVLAKIFCSNNQLTTLDVSKNTALTNLNCDHNQLTNLDISKNILMEAITCNSNKLTNLDTSKNTKLIRIECDTNKLTRLDTSKNPLTILNCSYNQLTTLDVSMNKNLNSVKCNSNNLTSLNLKNGNNVNFLNTTIDLINNPKLTCIQVDNVAFATKNWAKDTTASYSTYCESLYTLIPDTNFEQRLIDLGIDSGLVDGKILRSNISNLTSLNLIQANISDLTGIQDFISLTELYCAQNSLKTLDVSKNTALKILDCNNNQIAALDVSNNTALTELICYSNKLTSLDVKINTALTKLDSGSNLYTSLDVRTNTALTFLGCNTSQLTTIDVSKNTALTLLDCRENQIKALDVSNLTALKELYCQSNQLKDLDVSKSKSLELINCSKNQLTTLDISAHPSAIGLYANSNQLTSLNLKNGNNINFQLLYLNLKNNPNLSCIQVDDATFSNTNWTTIKDATTNFNTDCVTSNLYTYIPDVNFENKLIALGIDSGVADGKVLTSKISSLTSLDVSASLISDLTGIQDFTSLNKLNCGNNKLLSLNISNNKLLKELNCRYNDLTTLDVSANTGLTSLDCIYNHITTLDVSNMVELQSLLCTGNQITNLDVTKNLHLYWFGCNSNKLATLDVSQNKILQYLDCGFNQLTSLDVSNNIALFYLNCYHNKLTSINVSMLPELTSLACSANQLSSLNISKNVKLNSLLCEDINISTLDISTNTGLKELFCGNGQLKTLDVSKNKALTRLYCQNNQLTYLNIKNGSNTLLTDVSFIQNPNLSCIQVDDVAYSNKNWMNAKDTWATFNTACIAEYVSVPDTNFEQKLIDLGIDTDGLNGKITIADASSITTLNLSNSNIKNLAGIEHFTSLTFLDISNNQFTSLDLSNNLLLETLDASSNQLTTLDLSKNTKLKIVYVVNNPLVYLNLRNGNNVNFILPSNTGRKSASSLYTSFLGLTSLSCIQVDDENYSNANWSSIKESTTTYSNTCKSLGVDESTLSQTVIYPNPTKGVININNIALDKATVYNSLGQLVKSFTLNNAKTDNTIDLSGLPRGVYYVYLINGDAASAKKVIVE